MTDRDTTQPGETAEPMSPIFETRGGDGQWAAAVFADRTGPLARLAGWLHGLYLDVWWRLTPASLIGIINGELDAGWRESAEELIGALEDGPELTSTAAAITRIRELAGIHGATFIDEDEALIQPWEADGEPAPAWRELGNLVAMGRDGNPPVGPAAL